MRGGDDVARVIRGTDDEAATIADFNFASVNSVGIELPLVRVCLDCSA
jgi:hypothetical protein